MLKNTERYEEQGKAHFTYDDYKKRTKKRPNKDITIFISVFIVGVLIILGFAKILSPNVDVGITDSDKDYPSYSEEDDTRRTAIDERLKKLQAEDNGEMFSPELDEKVVIPKDKIQKVQAKDRTGSSPFDFELPGNSETNVKNKETTASKEVKKETKEHTETKQVQQSAPTVNQPSQPAAAPMASAKVVIGSYATEKQAEVAKTILQDSGVGVTPIIKNIGGSYTLQVGAYSTKEKAQQASSNLIKNNFPARVVVE